MNKSKILLLLLGALTVGVASGCKGNTDKPSFPAQNLSSSSVVTPSTSSSSTTIKNSSSFSTTSNSSSSSNNDNVEGLENKLKEKYKISPNQNLTIDQSQFYESAIGDVKNIENIEAIKFTFDINFNGADSGSQYWGGEIYIDGSATTYQSTSGTILNVDNDYNNIPESTTQNVFVEVKDLTSESIIKVMLYYTGGNYDFILRDITYYYSNGLEKRTESREYDLNIFSDNVSGGEQIIPLSDFENRSQISKIDLEFYSENEMDYTGGTIFFTGIMPITESNIVNIGDAMVANGSNTGVISIYTEHYLAFNLDAAIQLVCYWAPAKVLKLTKVTLHTDVEIIPDAPTNLVAHPGNGEVTLEWDESLGASSYEVYVDGILYSEVSKNYCVIDKLINGTTYEFYVVSKNRLGKSDDSMKVTCSPNENVEYNQFLDGLNTDIERMLGKTNIQSAFRNSIVSTNNNYRLKTALNKIKRGGNATFSYMGGSVTVGEGASIKTSEGYTKGYASYTNDFVNEYFGTSNNVKYINSAISGTGSEVGIVRLQKDVLDYNPDVVFVEFAVNNGNNEFCNETYEGLIRKIIDAPNSPAVVLVFSWTYYSGNQVEEYMTQVGNYYKLPMISIHKGLHEFKNELYEDFVADDVHPNDSGYKLYAKLLCNFLNTIDKEEMDEEYIAPSLTLNKETTHKYDNFKTIENNGSEINSLGSFEYNENIFYSGTRKAHVKAFDKGWMKTDNETNNQLEITVNAKNFILVYKSPISQNDGTIVINYENLNNSNIKGTITQNLNKYLDNIQTGWDNPISILVFDEDVVDTYRITISVQNTNEAATILALGYSD